MEKIKIGQIVNAVALKGEVKVYHYSDSKERFEDLTYIYIEEKKTTIQQVRYMKDLAILKLEGVDDRDGAEALKGRDVYIDEGQLRQLPEGTYYIRDLIGLEVRDQEEAHLGRLKNVIQNRAQDLYEIELENGKVALIPAVAEFLLDINMEQKYIKVRLIEGLLDL
ncbi:16S rRNA processing protein RimM [Aminipila butyrica]|uniref:Ribosome maturation factor RimM n=1 Tax=Aminipila butyrica TaxID=433296 RepID=A0A858BVS9_9FIRM|nr:ribosome maturation factor RimM [Aminipila butyrica]QIB69010.1 16S rRNA processing protein RimM [Aminipila butyrica]